MRIVIDVQAVQNNASKKRGVGRYVTEMVKSLARVSKGKHEIILLINAVSVEARRDIYFLFDGLIDACNIKAWQWGTGDINAISGNEINRCIAEMLREWYVARLQPDIFWAPNLQEGWHDDSVVSVNKHFKIDRVAVTLHDVIPLIFPEKYLVSHIKEWYLDKVDNTKKSSLVFTDSKYSKDQIVKLLGHEEGDVVVVEAAHSQANFFREVCDIREYFDFLESEKYIFYAGGMDEHKNLSLLFSAYAIIQKKLSDPPLLVLAGGDFDGGEGVVRAELSQHGVNQEDVKILGFVSDDILRKLYAQCLVFIFPSYSEGFGLPPLEAMACGAPVLCADAASLTEIVSFNDALFPVDDAEFLGAKIIKVAADATFRNGLIENSSRRVKAYSWDRSAEKILIEFENLFSSIDDEFVEPPSIDDLIGRVASVSDVSMLDDVSLKRLADDISGNFLPIREKKKFYVDISTLVHADHATGIQRVTRAIASELLKCGEANFDFSCVMSYSDHKDFYHVRKNGDEFIVPDRGGESDSVVDFSDGDVVLILDLHLGSLISKKDVVPKLQIRGVVFAAVVYDLLPIEFPDYFVPGLAEEFRAWLDVVALMDHALCISMDVSRRLAKYYSENKTKKNDFLRIGAFPLGADIANSKPSLGMPRNADQVLAVLKSSVSFLMVGTVEPRKAHAFVLDAFEKLWEMGFDCNLVIVGKRGWRNEAAIKRLEEHGELGSRLFWLEGISDQYLGEIYTSVKCLVAASLNEGFGLPLIEAAQHGLPVIARDIPVFREVAGDHAYYFNAAEPSDLVRVLHEWLALHQSGKHPRSDGMPWVTWRESAMKLRQILLGEIKKES